MKSKGSQYERQICKQLSLWWTKGKRDDVFWRTAGSGARFTARQKQCISTANSVGDVCYLDEIGKCLTDLAVIEIKRGYSKDISIIDLLDKPKKKSLILQWWNKAEEEKNKSGRVFTILIVKRDRADPVIVINSRLSQHIGIRYLNSVHVKLFDLIFVTLEEFLDIVMPELIFTIYYGMKKQHKTFDEWKKNYGS